MDGPTFNTCTARHSPFPTPHLPRLQVRCDNNTLEAALVLVKNLGFWDHCSLVCCLWLAMKLIAVRTAAPCRSLICSASSVCPAELSWRELEVCKALNWDLSALLREAGVVR